MAASSEHSSHVTQRGKAGLGHYVPRATLKAGRHESAGQVWKGMNGSPSYTTRPSQSPFNLANGSFSWYRKANKNDYFLSICFIYSTFTITYSSTGAEFTRDSLVNMSFNFKPGTFLFLPTTGSFHSCSTNNPTLCIPCPCTAAAKIFRTHKSFR